MNIIIVRTEQFEFVGFAVVFPFCWGLSLVIMHVRTVNYLFSSIVLSIGVTLVN